jgi:hypothetical protein
MKREDMIWELEMLLSSRCNKENEEREAKGIPSICNCPTPEILTDSELKRILTLERKRKSK